MLMTGTDYLTKYLSKIWKENWASHIGNLVLNWTKRETNPKVQVIHSREKTFHLYSKDEYLKMSKVKWLLNTSKYVGSKVIK